MTTLLDSKRRTAVLSVLESRGIIRKGGHFEYRSKDHGDDAVDTAVLYKDIMLLRFLARKLARHFKSMNIDTVVGLFGDEYQSAYLAMMVAEELVPATFVAGRKNNPHEMCSIVATDHKYVHGKRVLIVDDVVDRGDTMRSTIAGLKRHDANIVGIGVICDRGLAGHLLGEGLPKCKYRTLVQLLSKRWPKLRCRKEGPCKHGVPLIMIQEFSAYTTGK